MRPRWWIFLAAVLLCGASLAWAATSGPDPFPTHWGAGGAGDAWAPRGRAIAITTASMGGVAALFGLLARWTSAVPDHLVNLPAGSRAYWLAPDHRTEFDALLQRSLLTIGTGVLLLLAVTVAGTVLSPEGNPVLAVATWGFLALVLLSVAHLLWLLLRPPTG